MARKRKGAGIPHWAPLKKYGSVQQSDNGPGHASRPRLPSFSLGSAEQHTRPRPCEQGSSSTPKSLDNRKGTARQSAGVESVGGPSLEPEYETAHEPSSSHSSGIWSDRDFGNNQDQLLDIAQPHPAHGEQQAELPVPASRPDTSHSSSDRDTLDYILSLKDTIASVPEEQAGQERSAIEYTTQHLEHLRTDCVKYQARHISSLSGAGSVTSETITPRVVLPSPKTIAIALESPATNRIRGTSRTSLRAPKVGIAIPKDLFSATTFTNTAVKPVASSSDFTFETQPNAEHQSVERASLTGGSPSMATLTGNGQGNGRRDVSSPRPKGRENAKANTQCRNIQIYGHCRYENEGCEYNHSKTKSPQSADTMNNSARKQLNVDSPSFTPLAPSSNGLTAGSSPRSATISPRSANAAIFTPKNNKATTFTPAAQVRDRSSEWRPPQDFEEFVPQQQGYDIPQLQVQDQSHLSGLAQAFDSFSVQAAATGLGSSQQNAQINPYAQDAANISTSHFYANSTGYLQPLQYHLYAPSGPSPQNLLDYQRRAYDFFMPEDLRQDLQRKSEATTQTLPQSTLPAQVEVFHSLVPLDTSNQKNAAVFGYNSWLYKAVSLEDGRTYAIRRLENYRLNDPRVVAAVQEWQRVRNGSVVSVHKVMTTRAFGDSSLIIVMDYHPLSKTLAEHHFSHTPSRYSNPRSQPSFIEESELWSYIVQIASALKAIHSERLAARIISPSKVILTSKRRIRLSACGVLDAVKYSQNQRASDFQPDDFIQLGQLVLALATSNANPTQKSMEALSRSPYTQRLKDCVQWLLTPSPNASTPMSPTSPGPSRFGSKTIEHFLTEIADQVALSLDEAFHANDTYVSELSKELENGRLVRMLTKLNMINERPDFFAAPGAAGNANSDTQWSETGERYYLKLFRDFVFHQVDERGRPVTDLGWVIGCLNKLDAGSEEKVQLISRDEQNVLVVSFREVRRGLESAWQELQKAQSRR